MGVRGEVERIAREFFEIRYKLLPYLRGACDLAVKTGLPVMRSMALAHRMTAWHAHSRRSFTVARICW